MFKPGPGKEPQSRLLLLYIEEAMRILILLARNPKESLLVKLHTEELVREVKALINKNRHRDAISACLTKGNLEKRIESHKLGNIDADAVLSEDRVVWDLKK